MAPWSAASFSERAATSAQAEGKGKWVICAPDTVGGFSATLFLYTDFVGAPDALTWAQMRDMIASGTFEVLLTVDPGQTVLRPGQYVSVELEVARRDDVVVVPRDAIVWDHGQPVVFRVEPAPPEEAKDEAPPDEILVTMGSQNAL